MDNTLPYQDEVGKGWYKGYDSLLTPFMGVFIYTFLAPWVTSGWIASPPKKRISWWWPLATSILFSIDDLGTAIGVQAEETPRNMYEANPNLVQFHYRMREWGVATTLTDSVRIFYWINQLHIWLAWQFGFMNTFYKYFLLINGAVKARAGYQWWGLKPNNYTIWDFWFFKPGRECWERHSALAVNMYNRANDKKEAHKLYKDVKDSQAQLQPFLNTVSRRLLEMKAAGSRTARVVLPFFLFATP